MRVEMFNVGWMTAAAGILRAGHDQDEPIRFPIPAYLIETESERILVDTGLHPMSVTDPDGFYSRPLRFSGSLLWSRSRASRTRST